MKAVKKNPKVDLPQFHYPSDLPIANCKNAIVNAIRRNQVIILSGDTGSGKSTQIPKMCLEAGRKRIGHTQPRRIAAMTVARRIAEELHSPVGHTVGYKIRFEDRTSADTCIKIMTDGILLAEILSDPVLKTYDTIIIDEAHERSLNIDFLLGILRSLLKKRRDLKLVITSATIDTKKFSRAFENAPVIEVSGRLHPVEVRYRPLDPDLEKSEELTYIDAAIGAVEEIEREAASGDILVFMPTEGDIRETCTLLTGRKTHMSGSGTILPLFARLSWSEQKKIFAPSPARKIIVATNVAETSITIPGIRYVIDTGLARIARFNARTRTLNLPVATISRSSADQRKGRCGRVAAGVCLRLYSKENYESWDLFTEPEILRSNLAEVVLRMLSLNIGNIECFPFIDPPDSKSIRTGLETLRELGAIRSSVPEGIERDEAGGPGIELTDIGKRMAGLPIDPRIARMMIEAEKEDCTQEIAVIAAALSIQDPREWPFEQIETARKAHEIFQDPSSDFLTFLNIWNRCREYRETYKSQGRLRRFCKTHFLSYRRLREWMDVHNQLIDAFEGSGRKDLSALPEPLYSRIHKSILSGFLYNIAMLKEKNFYTAAKGREVMIFPGSVLFNKKPDWMMAAEIFETSRVFARTAAIIDRNWLERLGKNLCRSTYTDAHWERKRGEVTASEQVTLFGLIIVPKRAVSYGRIAPEEASQIFIQSALVDGDMERMPRFLVKNLGLIEDLSRLEDKLRRRDFLVHSSAVVSFYEERLPGVCDIRTLQKRIREKGGDDFLILKEEDLLSRYPDPDDLALFPDKINLGRLTFSLAYRFDPGSVDDGITAKIPFGMAKTLSESAGDWLVPGILREKITALLKILPKELRKRLVPVSETVETILRDMPRNDMPLVPALAAFIRQRFNLNIPTESWKIQELPDHLKMRFSITDEKGKEICSGRDPEKFQRELSETDHTKALEKAKRIWERENLTAWDFGDLPESIILEGPGGPEGIAYPALEEKRTADTDTIGLRLFANQREAEAIHRKGVRALFAVHFNKDLTYLKKQYPLKELKKEGAYFGSEKALEQAIHERSIRYLFPEPVRTRQEFFNHVERVSGKILSLGLATAREILPVLRAYSEMRQIIRAREKDNRSNKTALAFLSEIQNRLDTIIPRHFITDYDQEHLIHIPRYVKALEIRVERGLAHLEKDREKAGRVRIYEDLCRKLMERSSASESSPEKEKAIDEFRRQVEEYHVAVFAQTIRTAMPVSPKRLDEKYRQIEKMK